LGFGVEGSWFIVHGSWSRVHGSAPPQTNCSGAPPRPSQAPPPPDDAHPPRPPRCSRPPSRVRAPAQREYFSLVFRRLLRDRDRERVLPTDRLDHTPQYRPVYGGGGCGGQRARNLFSLSLSSLSRAIPRAGESASERRANTLQHGPLPASQGHNRALTMLYVPYSLDSGTVGSTRSLPAKWFREGLVFKAH